MRLRGMERDRLLEAVRRARSAIDAGPKQAAAASLVVADAGVRAVDAWHRTLSPLPAPPSSRVVTEASSHTGGVSSLPEIDDGAPFSIEGLEQIVVDAARRARSALVDGASLSLDLGVAQDFVRVAATVDDSRIEALRGSSKPDPALKSTICSLEGAKRSDLGEADTRSGSR